jgi:hypothetical protein
MISRSFASVLVSASSLACALAQTPAKPAPNAPATHAQLPVREVTAFKDGHAFVLREGELAANAGNEVVLDDLPAPVLGTFWPYASGGAKLVSAKAAKQRVKVERTALELRALLAANIGCAVNLVDTNNEVTSGTIVDVPKRSAEYGAWLRTPTAARRTRARSRASSSWGSADRAARLARRRAGPR